MISTQESLQTLIGFQIFFMQVEVATGHQGAVLAQKPAEVALAVSTGL